MTISSQRTVHKYVGDGAQDNWPVLFTFLEPEHVKAVKTSVDGVDVPLTYGTEYSVEVLEGGGGRCVASLAKDEQIMLFLDVPLTQETDLRNAGKLSAEVIERMSDKLTLALQQQREDLNRCVKVAATSSTTPEMLIKQLVESSDGAVKAKNDAEAVKEQTLQYKNDSAAQVSLAAAEVSKARTVVSDAEMLVENAQAAVATVPSEVAKAVTDEMEPVVTQAKSELNTINAQTLQYKNDSAAQVGLAAAEVSNARTVVSDAKTLVENAQAAVATVPSEVEKAVTDEMEPMVTQAKSELNTIKGQTLQYKNDSAAQVGLAAAEVVKAQGVVSDATVLVSDANDLIRSAQTLIDQASNQQAVDELLSGMVVPFKGIVNGSGHPVNRMTGAEDVKYALCDGRTYTAPDGVSVVTPDLRDKFIAGAGNSYEQGATGGLDTVELSVAQMPAHSHSVRAYQSDGATTFNDLMTSARTTTVERNVSETGGSKPHENRPPFYALAYLMKL